MSQGRWNNRDESDRAAPDEDKEGKRERGWWRERVHGTNKDVLYVLLVLVGVVGVGGVVECVW